MLALTKAKAQPAATSATGELVGDFRTSLPPAPSSPGHRQGAGADDPLLERQRTALLGHAISTAAIELLVHGHDRECGREVALIDF
jgi:hypothetical protein